MTRILAIGWRGAEAHFLRMLSEHIKTPVSVHVVAGGLQQANEVIGHLRSGGLDVKIASAANGGFTSFVLKRELESIPWDNVPAEKSAEA